MSPSWRSAEFEKVTFVDICFICNYFVRFQHITSPSPMQIMMVTLILSMVGAIWLMLTLLLSFGPFQQLLDHLCSVDPILRSRILDEVLPSTNGNVFVSRFAKLFLLIPNTEFAFLTAAAVCL